MTFIIDPKLTIDKIINRDIEDKFFKAEHKSTLEKLIEETSPEETTGYFFCADYLEDKHLLILGKQTNKYLTLFKEAAAGKKGFDKKNISFGSCFVRKKGNKQVLYMYLTKGKKMLLSKRLKSVLVVKNIKEVRWLDAPFSVDAKKSSKAESVANNKNKPKNGLAELAKKGVEEKAKDLKLGIDKMKKGIGITEEDAVFLENLIITGKLFISELTLTDENTRNSFSSLKDTIKAESPKWKKLAAKISSQKLQKVIERMTANRSKINTILKRVNLKALA